MTRKTVKRSSQRVGAPTLQAMKHDGRPITMLTAYDATFARLLDRCGIDVLLVGDSLGMVIKGEDNTLAVTVDDVIYHTRAVARGTAHAHLVADMPFMSYQTSMEDGLRNAGRLIKDGGAQAVKLEGGRNHAELVRKMTDIGIPVMGHIGLMPQSIHVMGGYRVQGRDREAARRLLQDALALQDAGAYALVLEAVPQEVARQISETLRIPTIGIGAGVHCDGQVLVTYDLLGMNADFLPRFVKRYDTLAERIGRAASAYADDVRGKRFPAAEHCWSQSKSRSRDESGDDATVEGDGERAAPRVVDPKPVAPPIPIRRKNRS